MQFNLQLLDEQLKNIRTELFNKYEEYFEKTDGHCKSAEMYTKVKLMLPNNKYFELIYKNFFELQTNSELLSEIPNISLYGINSKLYDRILDMKYSKILDISKSYDIYKKIGYTEQEIDILYSKFIDDQKYDFVLSEKINDDINNDGMKNINVDDYKLKDFSGEELLRFENKFYNYNLIELLMDNLFSYKANTLDDFYNINIAEILKEKITLFNDIKILLNLDKYDFSKDIYNVNNIKHIIVEIYSYVFGPNRMHEYNGENINSVIDNIKDSFINQWDFDIIDER